MAEKSIYYLNGKEMPNATSMADLAGKSLAGNWNCARGRFNNPDSLCTEVSALLGGKSVKADTAKVSTALEILNNVQYHWAYVWYML